MPENARRPVVFFRGAGGDDNYFGPCRYRLTRRPGRQPRARRWQSGRAGSEPGVLRRADPFGIRIKNPD